MEPVRDDLQPKTSWVSTKNFPMNWKPWNFIREERTGTSLKAAQWSNFDKWAVLPNSTRRSAISRGEAIVMSGTLAESMASLSDSPSGEDRSSIKGSFPSHSITKSGFARNSGKGGSEKGPLM